MFILFGGPFWKAVLFVVLVPLNVHPFHTLFLWRSTRSWWSLEGTGASIVSWFLLLNLVDEVLYFDNFKLPI